MQASFHFNENIILQYLQHRCVNPKKQGTAKQISCYLLVINGFQKVVH